MSSTLLPADLRGAAGLTQTLGRPADAWPNTRRPLPWAIGAFVVVFCLVPIDSTALPVHLPVDSKIDRFALILLFVLWLRAIHAGGPRAPRFRYAPVMVGVYVVVATFLLSVALDVSRLSWTGELTLSLKKLSLLASYLLFLLIVATSIGRDEVKAFTRIFAGAAALTALGTVIQYRTNSNLFFTLTGKIPGLIVTPLPPTPVYARTDVTGPALHGLADATLMSLAVPFAIAAAIETSERRSQVAWFGLVLLLLAGDLATLRKTAVIVPLVIFLVMAYYRPRQVLRYWALLVPGVLLIRVIAPSAISGIVYQLTHTASSNSTAGRTADYGAVAPDVQAHLLFGRGFGSYDPLKYRPLDNELLDMLVETGLAGLLAYVGMILSSAATVHRLARARNAAGSLIAVAVAAASAGFLVSNVLYDAFGFRQAIYAFFFVAGLGVALRDDPLALPPRPGLVATSIRDIRT